MLTSYVGLTCFDSTPSQCQSASSGDFGVHVGVCTRCKVSLKLNKWVNNDSYLMGLGYYGDAPFVNLIICFWHVVFFIH